MTPKQKNRIRDAALKVCKDQRAARLAWLDLLEEFKAMPARVIETARIAMLQAISDGKSIAVATKVARKVLA